MRVVNTLNPEGAPNLRQLPIALRNHPDIEHVLVGFDTFWHGDPSITDVLHLHWPESLFRWREPAAEDLEQLKSRLLYWRAAGSRIIGTIHNRYPHYRDTEAFRKLYEMVYSHLDGVIHMGGVSQKEFHERYPHLATTPSAVIPLGLPPFDATIRSSAAREALGIPARAFVVVSLGRIRNEAETRMLLGGFRKSRLSYKRLIIAGFRIQPIGRIARIWERLRITMDRSIISTGGSIPDEDVPTYVGSADVFVLPRLEILNSGGVATGFHFGKVVVGPATGVVGEILLETGNPTFVPGDAQSLAEALQDSVSLCREGKGEENREYAQKYWNWERLADEHVKFYNAVLRIDQRAPTRV